MPGTRSRVRGPICRHEKVHPHGPSASKVNRVGYLYLIRASQPAENVHRPAVEGQVSETRLHDGLSNHLSLVTMTEAPNARHHLTQREMARKQ